MSTFSRAFLFGTSLAFVVVTAGAQTKPERVDVGKREYESKCASCHGVSAKGDGVLRPFLTKSPPDLTTAAKNNGGVFPMDRLYQVIDKGTVGAHGTSDMPVWGRTYRMGAAEYYADVDYDESRYVRARVLALLEYLNRLQIK